MATKKTTKKVSVEDETEVTFEKIKPDYKVTGRIEDHPEYDPSIPESKQRHLR